MSSRVRKIGEVVSDVRTLERQGGVCVLHQLFIEGGRSASGNALSEISDGPCPQRRLCVPSLPPCSDPAGPSRREKNSSAAARFASGSSPTHTSVEKWSVG